jgi:hypothetical protein
VRQHRFGEAARRSRQRRVPRAGWIALGVFVAWLVVSLIRAATARALDFEPVPISPVTVAVPVAKAVASVPLKAAVSALLSVLEAIFGGVEAKLITGVINGLLAVPNFNSGHVAALEHTTVAISAGMLSAVLTLSIVRYYVVGLSNGGAGGFEALQGLTRVVGAVGFIVVWSGVFNEVVQIPKMFDAALLGSGSVQHSVALLFDAALVIGGGAFAINAGLGLIFVVLIGFLAAIVFIALLWMKVLLSVLMMFLYVAMPLCVALWPVPELGWLAASALKALFVGLLVPCVWALLFSLSAAVNADVLTWAPSHSIIDTVIIRPLAGITLMMLCITIPRSLMRTAMIGPGNAAGGWRIWRTVTFGMFALRGAAGMGRAVASAATEGQPTAQRMIDALPSAVRPPSEPGEGPLAGRIVFGRSGFGAQGSQPRATGNEKPKTASPAPESEQDTAPDATALAAESAGTAIRRQEAAFSVPGIERPAYDRAAVDRAWQGMHARSQMSPPTAGEVAGAMSAFPADTQRAIAAYQQANPGRMRQWAAHHAGSPSLSEGQRAAVLTLGSAPKAALESGIGDAMKVTEAQAASEAAGSTAGRTSSPAGQATAPTQNSGGQQPAAPSPRTEPASQSGPPVGEQPGGKLGGELEHPPSLPDGAPARDLPDPEPFIE